MAAPPVPPPLDQIGQRPFSFYPAIIGIEHNEWAFRRATWSEFLVFNANLNLELWIPRRYVGEVSRIDEPVMIVGLNKELEYKGGMVLSHERRVIEMPRSGGSSLPEPVRPAPSAMKLDGGAESRIGRLLLAAIAAGLVACILLVLYFREGRRISYQPVIQSELGFTGSDDYWSVVNRLGKPAGERWRSAEGEIQYQLLDFPRQNLYVILMGPDRRDMHYVGAFDRDWHVVGSTNADTGHVLHTLKRF